MKRRLLKILAITFTFLIAALAFLLGTEPGLRLVVRYIPAFSGGSVSIAESEGRLFGSWQVRGVTVHTNGADVRVGQLGCSWSPANLLQRQVHFGSFEADHVEIILTERSQETAEEKKQHRVFLR